MPDITLNQDAIIGVSFYNDTGPITGVSDMVATVINRNTGTTIATYAATESPAGSGYYTATILAALITGPMRLSVTFSSDASDLYEQMFVRARNIPAWSVTRRELRQGIARLMDGQDSVYDMDATGGTTTTAIVPTLNYGGGDEYMGQWVRFTDGVNRGATRRVLGYDEATYTLTFGPALTAAVASGDRVEMYTLDPRTIDGAILAAYATVGDMSLVPFSERMITTDGTATEFQLPSDAVSLTRVGMSLTSSGAFLGWLPDGSYDMRPNQIISLGYRYLDDRDPFRWDTPSYRAWPSGYTIWIEGMARIEPPLYDDSYVDVPPAYISAYCHWQLSMQRRDLSSTWPFLKRVADEEKKRAVKSMRGRYVR